MTHSLHHFRYEIRSARHLGELAAAPLPLPIAASVPKRSQHRDLYLDTPDNSLRKRNIVCRLRLRSDGKRILSLTIGGDKSNAVTRVDSNVKSADIVAAVAEPTEVGRRISGIVDPKTLIATLELETERLTRTANNDWLGRQRMELHYDCVVVRRNGRSSSLFYLCIHQVRGDAEQAEKLSQAMSEAHHLRLSTEGARDRAESVLRWKGTGGDAHRSSNIEGTPHLRRRSVDRGEFLNPELSLLAFQSRVLAVAEDARTPLAERLRFLES